MVETKLECTLGYFCCGHNYQLSSCFNNWLLRMLVSWSHCLQYDSFWWYSIKRHSWISYNTSWYFYRNSNKRSSMLICNYVQNMWQRNRFLCHWVWKLGQAKHYWTWSSKQRRSSNFHQESNWNRLYWWINCRGQHQPFQRYLAIYPYIRWCTRWSHQWGVVWP